MSDYEKPLIDACLTDKKSLYRVVGELKPDDFESNVCQKAFITISNLVKEGKPVTITTLCDQVKSIPPDLFTPNHINGEELEYFISKVKEQGKGRQLKRIIAQCQDITEREEMGIDEKIQLVQDVILSSFGNYKKEEVSTHAIGDMVLKMYEEKKQRRLDGDDIITLPIGIKELDSIMGGWQPGTLTVIGGRQGHGKSTLAMDFSFNLILKEHPTLYLTLEQGSVEIFLYHLQKYTTYSPLNIKLGNLSEGDEALLRQAIEKFKKFPLFINDRARTLSDVVTTIRTLHLTESIEVVIIDYLQLIENPRKGEPRHIEVAGISRTLKQLAMQLNASIIALSQLNKEPEGRTNKRIYLSDTRESEAITQDADYVIFLYRPSIYGDDERDYISLAKNRHGMMIEKIHLKYNQQYNRYKEV